MYLNDELKYNKIKKEIGPNPNIKNLTSLRKNFQIKVNKVLPVLFLIIINQLHTNYLNI